MEKIDFTNTKPYFEHNNVKWYYSKELNDYLNKEQAFNLPKLEGYGVFVVVDHETNYVLIDDAQNLIRIYNYSLEGFEQMIAFINIMKIDKHFKKHEKENTNLKSKRKYAKN